jgi:AraC-like DNA-binding protein
MTVVDIIPIIGFVQGLFFCLILLTLKKGLRKANGILSLLILSITLTIANPITHPLDRILVFAMLLFGPLFLLYTFLLTKPDYRIDNRTMLHFLPFIIVMILVLTNEITAGRMIGNDVVRVFHYLKNLHALGYSIAILLYLKRYRRSLKSRYSNIERLGMSWISAILSLFILYFAVISPIVGILILTGYGWIVELESSWTPILISIYIFFLGYNGLRHHQVFITSPINEHDSRLSYSESQAARLAQVIEKKKPYLSDDLTLDSLSEETRIPSHVLSRIINNKYKKNFFDYINSHRIDHFNKLYLDERNNGRTVLDMALESGFYSKSTFNLSYKKYMGMTPTQFRSSQTAVSTRF